MFTHYSTPKRDKAQSTCDTARGTIHGQKTVKSIHDDIAILRTAKPGIGLPQV